MASVQSKKAICRLCLEVILNKNVEIINDLIKDILDILLLKLKFEGGSKDFVCSYCREKLNAALEFKSICLNTDNKIIPYVDCEKMLQLDLREVYMMEKESGQLTGISEYHQVCRLCLQLVRSDFRHIHEEEMAAIQKFVPEMNINIIINPIVCKKCFDSLNTHNLFLNKCFYADNKIGQICDISTTACKTDDELSLDLFVKTECLDKEWEINEIEMSLKAEPIEIKSEENEDEEESNTPLSSLNEEATDSSNYKDVDKARNICEVKPKNTSKKYDQSDLKRKQKGIVSKECGNSKYTLKSKNHFTIHSTKLKIYKCDMCDYKTKRQYFLGKRQLKHEKSSEVPVFKCNEYNFNSKSKGILISHKLKHKNSSQVQATSEATEKSDTSFHDEEVINSKIINKYICDVSDIKTKFKSSVVRHQLKHKNFSEVYKCDACNFKTKYESNLRGHQLKHKNFSKLQVYKCDTCDYRTKFKCSLTIHKLKHRYFSEVQTYKCGSCDFRAKFKSRLISHQLKHKDFSEVQTYKCDTCDYRTKRKCDLISHQLKHKDFSEVQTYNCDTCDYRTKRKCNLISHQLKHKDFSEVQTYKCDTCDYRTKFKSYLTKHQLKHKDFSEVQTYKCDTCDYRTKRKCDLISHQLKHKDFSEVQTYKCDTCDFRTKRKCDLISHQLKHKDFSEVQTYKCDTCDFRTKFKSSLTRHQQKHIDFLEVQHTSEVHVTTEPS